ncbi:hypothetical protein ACJMK2_023154 [Sinanodonta woodiana]|uniref:Uncharacterized protein n=1 Tax=Sinanodonta woodiana TaxID=1069815 RepID=A0ABD3T4L4_SINWO
MTKDTFWIFAFYLPTVAVLTEILLPEHKTYVTDALSRNEFVLKTWPFRGPSVVFIVAKENKTLLEFFPGYSFMDQKTRLFIKYNNITEEVSLLINNVTRDDEGLYQISSLIIQKPAKGDKHISNSWNVQLNILEPSEIKQGNAGENMLIAEFLQESIFFDSLYHNDQLIAVLRDSDCDVSTTSQFYGRIRCSKDKDNNTTRIEINHVTENDTGLYTVKTESSLTQRCFLNITGSFTNSVSQLTSVTTPDRFDENNSDQPSNITLSATILSGQNVNRASLYRELSYILQITMVAVVAIVLVSGSLIWIQRRNVKSFKAVQRIVIETMETTSSAALSTLGRCPHTPLREEIWTSNANSLENTFTNPAGRLLCPIPKVSTSGHISCHSNTQQLDDGYYKSDVTDNIFKICQSRSISNMMLLDKCDECPGRLLNAYPSPSNAFSESEREEHLDISIFNANAQYQPSPNTEATYAVVKKSSRNNDIASVYIVLQSYEEEESFSGRKEEQEEEISLSGKMEEQGEEITSSGRKEERGEEIAWSGRKV